LLKAGHQSFSLCEWSSAPSAVAAPDPLQIPKSGGAQYWLKRYRFKTALKMKWGDKEKAHVLKIWNLYN